MTIDPHARCTSNAYKWVTCDRCGRRFQCTPWEDFYCAAEGDHCCEPCLVASTGATKIAFIDPAAPLAEPVWRDLPR